MADDLKPAPQQEAPRWWTGVGRHFACWSWFYGCMLIGHLAKENYFPFSNWPMYSNFTNNATYAFATDGNGNEVGWRTFGESSARVKRQFENEVKRFERVQKLTKAEAQVVGGEAILARLSERLEPVQRATLGGSLTLHYMSIQFTEPKVVSHLEIAKATVHLSETGSERGRDQPEVSKEKQP